MFGGVGKGEREKKGGRRGVDVCVKGSRNSATLVTSVSSPQFPSQDDLLGDLLAIAGQPQEAHEVNEGCG